MYATSDAAGPYTSAANSIAVSAESMGSSVASSYTASTASAGSKSIPIFSVLSARLINSLGESNTASEATAVSSTAASGKF